MTRPGSRMIDVELVGDAPDDAPDDPPQRPNASRRTRHPRRRVLGAAAVLVLVVALGSAVRAERVPSDAERRDDTEVAAFAAVPGVAPSLREPLTERWRLAWPGSIVGDLVLAQESVDGAPRTVAREAGTGDRRWVAPVWLDADGRRPDCSVTTADGSLLLCEVPGEPGQGGPTTDAELGGSPDVLAALRTSDGQVVTQWSMGTTSIGWAVTDDDVVLATRDGATGHVQRWTAADGPWRSRWQASVPLTTGVLAREVALSVDDGLAVLSGPVAGVLDVETGAVLGTWTSERGRLPVRVATSSAGFAVWTGADEGIWHDRAGAPGARLPGDPVRVAVDDGSYPRVVLVQADAALLAVDVDDGVLWEWPAITAVPMRLDGMVVVQDGAVLRVLDLRSGQEVWFADGSATSPDGLPITDGLRLLVGDASGNGQGDAAPWVTARDLHTGQPLWTTALPRDVISVSVGDGVLVRLADRVALYR